MNDEPKSTSRIVPGIIAGLGIGGLNIGDSPEKVRTIMRAPGVLSDYDTEHKVFNDFGYVPEHYLQFLIGFDSLDIFHEDENPAYPVFKVYYKSNATAFMIISSYGTEVYDYGFCRRITTEKGISFGDSEGDIRERYGKEDIKHIYSTYDGDYMFLRLGISFILEEGKVRVIRIFNPITDSKEIKKIEAHYKKIE